MENWIQKEIDRLQALNYSILCQEGDLPKESLTSETKVPVFIQYNDETIEALNHLFTKHKQNPPLHEIEKLAIAFLPEFKIKTENLDFENNDRGILVDFINQPI